MSIRPKTPSELPPFPSLPLYPMYPRDFAVGPDDFGGEDYPSDPQVLAREIEEQSRQRKAEQKSRPSIVDQPITTPEQEQIIKAFYQQTSQLNVDNSWIQTYTGKKFFPLNPRIEDICIEDIAHALSMQCRFTGHVKRFYSVAEHSVLVSYLCNEQDQPHAVLHDGSEYTLTDFPSPLKRSGKFENYKKYEKVLQSLIYQKFGLSTEEPASVKRADLQLFATESRDLMSPLHPEWHTKYKPLPFKIIGLPPHEAEQLFLERFHDLFPAVI